MKLEELSEGDRVLFNDRATPLEVEKVDEDAVIVAGPKGGEYELYEDDGTLLVCKKGSRRYSSYCEDLRKVGEWKRDGDEWKHSKTGVRVWLEEDDNGFWTVESDTFEPDNPMYGFSSKEFAVEEAESIVEGNPAGEA
ncbi:MAG: hypothetical protein ABEK16_00315 [Candidatus Nanohalobium sp.]